MNIKEVSEKLDVPRETLRYWENLELIPAVPRNSSGYRDYTENEIKWVLFIKAMRKAGMSIEALTEWVELYRDKKDKHDQQKKLLQEQLKALQEKRFQLDKTINYLSYKINHFDQHVIPFLDEKEYYDLKKDQLLKK